MFTQQVYVEGTFMGSFERGLKQVHAQYDKPFSYAWFCPSCGDVWARALIAGHDYQIQGGYCHRHPGPSPYTVAGSLLLAWDEPFNQLLLSCPDVVVWEARVHLQFASRSLL